MRKRLYGGWFLVLCWGFFAAAVPLVAQTEPRRSDVPYVPTPEEVVAEMLKLANVSKGDVVYDLGCGDGRIIIASAKAGARGVGVDIDPDRIRESNENAEKAGVADRVKFIEGDLFEANISGATVVTLYLLPEVNLRLRPKLLRELKPGTRIVSHNYDLGDWKPEKTVRLGDRILYYWVVPEATKDPGQ